MSRSISLFIMVDACGWEIIRNDPFAQKFALARLAEVRHRGRLLVELTADPVPDEVAHHRIAVRFDVLLNRRGDVADPEAGENGVT